MPEFIQTTGPLFEAVQKSGLFPDGKTFVDSYPIRAPQSVLADYEREKKPPGFQSRTIPTRKVCCTFGRSPRTRTSPKIPTNDRLHRSHLENTGETDAIRLFLRHANHVASPAYRPGRTIQRMLLLGQLFYGSRTFA